MKNTPKILNLLGLATALAVFMILMAQVRYDRRYNRCFANSERIYRVEDNTENQGYSHWISDQALPRQPRRGGIRLSVCHQLSRLQLQVGTSCGRSWRPVEHNSL